tara:strand:+ start:6965 stop:7462 length:498 start_codon:yes stop_codon:yes gene_type:complete
MSGTDLEILIPKLRRFARALYCNKADADDAVCDSLEAAMEAGQISGDEIITTELWLFNALIAGARRRFASDGGKPVALPASVYPTDIEQAMAGLTVEHRAVVALHILEGVGLEDTADVLGTPMTDVRDTLDTAREHLANSANLLSTGTPTYPVGKDRLGSEWRAS